MKSDFQIAQAEQRTNGFITLGVVILCFVASIVYLGVLASYFHGWQQVEWYFKLLFTCPAWMLQILGAVIAAKHL